jgi:hypothetical protein
MLRRRKASAAKRIFRRGLREMQSSFPVRIRLAPTADFAELSAGRDRSLLEQLVSRSGGVKVTPYGRRCVRVKHTSFFPL